MKVLWLCNMMLPKIAKQLHRESSHKEGWLTGISDRFLQDTSANVELAVAFPVDKTLLGCKGVVDEKLHYYGFYENLQQPQRYDAALEKAFVEILEDFKPDLVHCFGTEYPHTLAMCRVFPNKQRLLIGIQGLCSVYANAFYASLPEQVIHKITFRDVVKKDTLPMQKRKYELRGKSEIEALSIAGNITGRTHWDKHYAELFHKEAEYYFMNETLRSNFYEGQWSEETRIEHRLFISQGDYPIKGLHYMLYALWKVKECYPDATLAVAGNCILREKNLKGRLKISAYGSFVQNMMDRYDLWDSVTFLGSISAEEMKQQLLMCHAFVCPSSIENSPNSLGEAMLLGVPCISADVGGIKSIFENEKDGILYHGFSETEPEVSAEEIANRLADSILKLFLETDKVREYCKNARAHAQKTHDGNQNYQRLLEIYHTICREE